MLKVLSYILCDLDPKVKVIGQKAGICDGVPSASALVYYYFKITVPRITWKIECIRERKAATCISHELEH